MTDPRYNKIISLNQDDYDKLMRLQKIGYTIVAVFRKGLEVLENGNKPKDVR